MTFPCKKDKLQSKGFFKILSKVAIKPFIFSSTLKIFITIKYRGVLFFIFVDKRLNLLNFLLFICCILRYRMTFSLFLYFSIIHSPFKSPIFVKVQILSFLIYFIT